MYWTLPGARNLFAVARLFVVARALLDRAHQLPLLGFRLSFGFCLSAGELGTLERVLDTLHRVSDSLTTVSSMMHYVLDTLTRSCASAPPPSLPPVVWGLRTTAWQKCGAVPRRAHI